MAIEKDQFTVPELQEVQKSHDVMYHDDLERLDIIRQIAHTASHVHKVMGILADFLEKSDHVGFEMEVAKLREELKTKRIPDMLAFTLKLANLFEINLIEAYWQRIMEDRHKQKDKLKK